MKDEAPAVVRRFHELLVEEIRQRRPEYLHAPFTVAEIYQDLVPYSSHRDRLGVEMNGDYEDALLRLLAGEGGYLLLDSEAAVRELREELETANPNTGIYREFAAVDVRLSPGVGRSSAPAARSPADLAAGTDAPGGPPELDLQDGAPARGSSGPGHAGGATIPAASSARSGSAAGAPAASASCRWCRAELPARASVRFCPFCGGDVNAVPCPQCGEELDADWRFCVACGAEVDS